MNTKQLINLTGLIALFISASGVQAEDFRARIVKVQGEVYIVNAEGEERKPEKTQFLVNEMETIVTRKDGKAVVQFDDGAMSVMDEKSRMRVEQSGWLSHLGGKVYYIFRKVFGKEQPKQVKTNFATIGIRGTTFIIFDDEESNSIALQEGKLNIESPGDDFEIHRKTPTDDFESFKQQAKQSKEALQKEFSDYREKIGKEFVEYKKSFELEADRIVHFDGNKVNESGLTEDIKAQFKNFNSFAEQYINAYRELDESTKME